MSDPLCTDVDHAHLAHLLSQVEAVVTRRLAAALIPEGCTVEQWRVLDLLARGGPQSMSELANFVLLPAPSLTRLIDRMTTDNLVYRTADHRDRRRVLVHLAGRGESLHDRAAGRVAAVHEALDAAADTGRLAHLGELLMELLEQLETGDSPEPPRAVSAARA